MTPNELLLAHLAAASEDDSIVRAMSSATFGLTGQIGPQGFGATTLERYLVLFTHSEFYAVAGLPSGLDAVETTARQAAEYAKAVGLTGFVLNPGTHQRFVADDAVVRLHSPLRAPDRPRVPVFAPWNDPSPSLVRSVKEAAQGSSVEAVWLAQGSIVVTHPHPDPAFEAALLARDVRMRSFAAQPAWAPVYERESPAPVRVRFTALTNPLATSLAADLAECARRQGLVELWAFEAVVEEEERAFAFAYTPHPHDAFAREFDLIHARHALGSDSPLLDAETLRDVLSRIGTPLL